MITDRRKAVKGKNNLHEHARGSSHAIDAEALNEYTCLGACYALNDETRCHMKKTGTRRIETHRLILRPFRIEDAADMFNNWASDPEVTRFLTWPTHTDAGVSRVVLESWIARYPDGGFFNWAIEWRETGVVIGSIAVVKLNEATEAADIGYCLSRKYFNPSSLVLGYLNFSVIFSSLTVIALYSCFECGMTYIILS